MEIKSSKSMLKPTGFLDIGVSNNSIKGTEQPHSTEQSQKPLSRQALKQRSGEDRRKNNRRATQQRVLLDTRGKQDRRQIFRRNDDRKTLWQEDPPLSGIVQKA